MEKDDVIEAYRHWAYLHGHRPIDCSAGSPMEFLATAIADLHTNGLMRRRYDLPERPRRKLRYWGP